ncbi:hypothetical protein ANN_18739 [Periplaneta americana]|uniref:Uncharacterized protein n=1 Tax=Periplaneta americana TaxID=6978 RepID=A0ABQ8SR10_PERAM|nr:hypothetical protein ANN_18739 [Periplaneta americana]
MAGLCEGHIEPPGSLKAMAWLGLEFMGEGHYGPALRPVTIYCTNPQARHIPKPTLADYIEVRCVPRFEQATPLILGQPPPCAASRQCYGMMKKWRNGDRMI